MWEFLEFIENSSFSVFVRETPSVLLYPTVLAIHAFGMAALVGFSTMIALRVLGFASGVPLAPLERFYKLINVGLWLNAISGVVLLVLAPTTFLVMPLFYAKLIAIAVAVIAMYKLRSSLFGGNAADNRVSGTSRTLAVIMLFFWGIAIQAGRLTAYAFFPTGWRTIVATSVAVVAAIIVLRIGGSFVSEKVPEQATLRTGTGYDPLLKKRG